MTRKVISLFTGIGGLDVGLEQAGFEPAIAVECDPIAVRTLAANRVWRIALTNGEPARIEQISSRTLLRQAGLRVGDATAVVGGPPCQPFSKAGYWARGDSRRLKDPRARTLREFFRVVHDVLPQVFLLENVPGMGFAGKQEALAYIERKVDRINRERGTAYRVATAELNAADFGVPQIRRRLFVVGHREGREFRFPHPSHGSVDDAARTPYTTAWESIGDLMFDDDPALRVRGKWAGLLPTIPEGHNYQFHTERGGGLSLFGWRTRYWMFLLKLAKTRPAWTLHAQPGPAAGPFHWRNRRLSPRELARLQTIPDSYQIPDDLRSAQRLIGNAVPSALAELLGLEIRRQLLDERDVSVKPTLLPKRKARIPGPERRHVVPSKYRSLEGKHDPHPGNGLGPGALARRGRC